MHISALGYSPEPVRWFQQGRGYGNSSYAYMATNPQVTRWLLHEISRGESDQESREGSAYEDRRRMALGVMPQRRLKEWPHHILRKFSQKDPK